MGLTELARERKGYALFACALAVLAAAVHPWDGDLSAALYRDAGLQADEGVRSAAMALGFFGKGDVAVFLAGLAGVCGMRRKATAALLALIICVCMVFPLKGIAQRERPRGSSNASFPSADVATATATAFTLAAESALAAPVAGALAASVAVSRVYFGAHYPADVLAGMAIGVLAAALALSAAKARNLKLPFWLFALAVAALTLTGILPHLLGRKLIPTRFGFEIQSFLPVFWPAVALFAGLAHLRLARLAGFKPAGYRRLL